VEKRNGLTGTTLLKKLQALRETGKESGCAFWWSAVLGHNSRWDGYA
jgi:hypothetical protein